MNGPEDQIRNQARADGASTASVVELLNSILDQVRRQQAEARVTAELEGEAARAVLAFQEIDAALDVATQSEERAVAGVPSSPAAKARRARGR